MSESKYNYSVIIPHFTSDGNVDLLKRAVKSVPDRTDIQVIVVDNSHTPIPQDLFPERNNVKIIYSSNERKAGGARNVGMDESDAKWYLFLDADDFFTHQAFEVFDSHKDSINDLEFSLPTSVYSDNIYQKANRDEPYASYIREFINTGDDTVLRQSFLAPVCKMVRSKMVKENNIRYDEVPASNDMMFALKTGLAANSVGADARETYVWTVSRGSITRTKSLENLESQFYVAQRMNKFLKERGYKKKASQMYFILQSAKFGVKPFCKLLFTSIKDGNIFIGWKNWIKTYMRLYSKKAKEDNERYNINDNK